MNSFRLKEQELKNSVCAKYLSWVSVGEGRYEIEKLVHFNESKVYLLHNNIIFISYKEDIGSKSSYFNWIWSRWVTMNQSYLHFNLICVQKVQHWIFSSKLSRSQSHIPNFSWEIYFGEVVSFSHLWTVVFYWNTSMLLPQWGTTLC